MIIFFGSDFEFFTFLLLVMPNYYFLRNFFLWTNIREATIIPRILNKHRKRFSLQVKRKNVFQKTQMTSFYFVKIVFQNFVHLKAPEVVFSPYV
jgi:hypothetical protein